MEYITKKEAFTILDIRSRQQLYNLVKKYNIKTKSQGRGKSTLYLKEDVLKVELETSKKRASFSKNKDKGNSKLTKAEIKREAARVALAKRVDAAKANNELLLNEVGNRELIRIKDILKQQGRLEDIDETMIIAYALTWQKYTNALYLSSLVEDIEYDNHGNAKINPYFTMADRMLTQLHKFTALFGIGIKNRGEQSNFTDSKMGDLLGKATI